MVTKSLTASQKPIKDIFDPHFEFHIPEYQRPYSWGEEQARELFDDLLLASRTHEAIDQAEPYFLGSIVLVKGVGPRSLVIDGQQRLTTLTILLSAVRTKVSGEHRAQITAKIYEKGAVIFGTQENYRLTLRERDSAFFRDYIQREDGLSSLIHQSEILNDAQRNIKSNALLFDHLLQEMTEPDLIRLTKFIFTSCFVVVVETPDEESAYRIFSVLNARGLDISITDLLKATIIGSIPQQSRLTYSNRWEEIEERLGREDFSNLFSHIRTIYKGAKIGSTLLKEFKEAVLKGKTSVEFIDQELVYYARVYECVINYTYEGKERAEIINGHLRWLGRLEFADWIPPTIQFFRKNWDKPKNIETFCASIERLSYGMLIMKMSGNERIERFAQISNAIATGIPQCDIVIGLETNEKRRIISCLLGPFYEKFGAKARLSLLLKLDFLLSDGSATYHHDVITIEHILPQNPPDNSEWSTTFPNPNDRAEMTHCLGNLVLLARGKNSAASNYSFKKKKDVYFQKNGMCPFVMTQRVIQTDAWTPNEIQLRLNQAVRAFASWLNIGKSVVDAVTTSTKIETDAIDDLDADADSLTEKHIRVADDPYEAVAERHYIVNTNTQDGPQDEKDMLTNKKVAAYLSPWKQKIERLCRGDVVFLYKNGAGIIASGSADGKLNKAPYHGDADEEYYMNLNMFFKVNPPLSAAEIRSIVGSKVIFNRTCIFLKPDFGRAILKACHERKATS